MKTVRGTMHGGGVVLDETVDVPEGTRVLVQVPDLDWLEAIAGAWKDDEGIEQWLRERKTSRTMSSTWRAMDVALVSCANPKQRDFTPITLPHSQLLRPRTAAIAA